MAYQIRVQDTSTKEVKTITVAELIAVLDDSLVIKETGKGLSTNDFTDALETKLNALPLAADLPVKATTPTISSGTTAPSSTPGKIGDIFIDTAAPKMYVAKGATASTDWFDTMASA